MGKKKQHGGKREGAGRKPGPEGPTVTVVATVPETLVEALNALAEQKGWNRSRAVTEAIRRLVSAKR
jgi:hypothetical protein